MYRLNPGYEVKFLPGGKTALFSEQENYFIQSQLYTKIITLAEQEKLDPRDSDFYENTDLKKAFDDLVEKNILINTNSLSYSHLDDYWYSNNKNPCFIQESLGKNIVTVTSYIPDFNVDLMHSSLKDVGIKTGNNGSVHVVIVNDYLDKKISSFADYARSKNIPWLIIKPSGKIIWVGPFFNSSKKFCVDWSLVTTRLKENSHAKVDMLGYDSEDLTPKTFLGLPTNISIAFNIAANEILKWVLTNESNLTNKIFTLNNDTLESAFHSYPSYFDEFQKKEIIFSEEIELQCSKKNFYDLGGERNCSPEETFEKSKDLLSNLTGIISKQYYKKESNYHIFYGPRSLNFMNKHVVIPPRSPEIVVGKSKNLTHAKVAFVAEAVERYFSTDNNLIPKKLSCYSDILNDAIHPHLLLNFSASQYMARDDLNLKSGPYHWIPQKFNEFTPIHWVKLKSLSSKKQKYFPVAYCFMNYPLLDEILMCPGDSNGNSCGNSYEEALFYGLLELVERDAMAIWWYNRLKCPIVDLDSFNCPQINETVQKLYKNGRILRVIDITTDIQIPSFVAVSWKKDGSRIIIGSASHLDPLICMQRAIAEHNQILTRSEVSNNINLNSLIPAERGLVNWILHEKMSTQTFIGGNENIIKESKSYLKLSSDDFLGDINTCMKELKKCNLEAYWLPLTTPNFPLKVIKVISPGMRHFWRRLGNGRLYDVPVNLGFFNKTLKEDELNPIPYFV